MYPATRTTKKEGYVVLSTIKMSVAALALSVCLTSAAAAETVTYTLEIDPGDLSWVLTADVSLGDNFGLASYGATVNDWSTLLHVSPVVEYFNVAPLDSDPAGTVKKGFNTLRSGNGVSLVSASQDTLGGAGVVLVYGLGQAGGTLSSFGVGDFAFLGPVQNVYGAPLLIAQGTYTSTLPSLGTAFGNVFTTSSGASTESAAVETNVIVIPEPASIALLGLAAVALLRSRR